MCNWICQLMQQVFAGLLVINLLVRASQNRTTGEILLFNQDIIICFQPAFKRHRSSFHELMPNKLQQTLFATTYAGFQELPPLGFKVKHHASPGSWQSGASYQQDEKHDVGQGGGHPHYLECMKWGNQATGRLRAVEVHLGCVVVPSLKFSPLSTGWSTRWWKWEKGTTSAASEPLRRSSALRTRGAPERSSCRDETRDSPQLGRLFTSPHWCHTLGLCGVLLSSYLYTRLPLLSLTCTYV